MHIEVEIKAWVRNPRALEGRLEVVGARFVRDYRKDDRYFRFEENNIRGKKFPRQDVRIRVDSNKILLTYKDRKLEDTLEINTEHEFEISDADEMQVLLERIGAVELVRKIKIGSAWRIGELLVEVSEILSLGHFIEVEQILTLPDSTPETELNEQVQKVRSHIIDALSSLNIPPSDHEQRSYTSMLSALERARTDNGI